MMTQHQFNGFTTDTNPTGQISVGMIARRDGDAFDFANFTSRLDLPEAPLYGLFHCASYRPKRYFTIVSDGDTWAEVRYHDHAWRLRQRSHLHLSFGDKNNICRILVWRIRRFYGIERNCPHPTGEFSSISLPNDFQAGDDARLERIWLYEPCSIEKNNILMDISPVPEAPAAMYLVISLPGAGMRAIVTDGDKWGGVVRIGRDPASLHVRKAEFRLTTADQSRLDQFISGLLDQQEL